MIPTTTRARKTMGVSGSHVRAVLDQGTIVAQGTHRELRNSSLLYARLSELQFKEAS